MNLPLKKELRPYYHKLKFLKQRNTFKQKVKEHYTKNLPLKIVIGSGGKFQSGWIPTEIYILNLLKEKQWKSHFKKDSLTCLLAEHVWEHLSLEDGKKAAHTCFSYLKKGGWLRIAVPDGLHKNKDYIDQVKPGGYGMGADDHKILYNYKSLRKMLIEVGFQVELLEYFDENGQFHYNEWDKVKGNIRRSRYNDPRNADGNPNYTSLIVDAIKP